MAATLDEVDDAIFEALGALKGDPKTPGKVLAVDRYAGELAAAKGILHATKGRAPLLLLACLGGDAQADKGQDTILGGEEEVCDRAVWAVVVVVHAPQGDKQALKGSATHSGAFRLVTEVRALLHGLAVDGTYQSRPVAYAGWRWHAATEPGKAYVAVVRFVADTAVDMTERDEETESPLKIVGEVEKRGGFEDAEDPADTEFEVNP